METPYGFRLVVIALLLISTGGVVPILHSTRGADLGSNAAGSPVFHTMSTRNETNGQPLTENNPCMGSAPLNVNVECGIPTTVPQVGTVDVSAILQKSQGFASPLSWTNRASGPSGLGRTGSKGLPTPLAVSPTENNGFNGINGDCNFCTGIPPDVQMAVGPNHVMEMVNTAFEAFTKSGGSYGIGNLTQFFGMTRADHYSDPRLLYDSLSGRWFASLSDITPLSSPFLKIAVSKTNDPTGLWQVWQINPTCQYSSVSTCVPDQPHIGVSNDKLVISVNIFRTYCPTGFPCASGWDGDQYWALNKRQLTEGASNPDTTSFGIDANLYSVQPAQSLSSNDDLYMVQAGCTVSFPSASECPSLTNIVTEVKITGLPPNSGSSKTTFTMATVNAPPQANQPGTTTTVWYATGGCNPCNDARVQSTVWFNGKLWFALNDGCGANWDCIRLGEIDTSAQTLVQSNDWTLPGPGTTQENLFFPAVTVDTMGNLVMVYGYSDAGDYPSIGVVEQLVTDPTNTISGQTTLVAGSTINNSGRYGDYFAAAVDPANTTNVWLAGEYMDSGRSSGCSLVGGGSINCYSTFIGSMASSIFNNSASPNTLTLLQGATTSSTDTISSVNAFQGTISFVPSASVSITATSIDDNSQRTFGILFDHSLDTQFWVSQPSSVIGCCQNPFPYSNSYSLTTGTHFLEFGVSAWVGQWRAQITVNGATMATVDTDVNHHVHVIFQVGGVSVSQPPSLIAAATNHCDNTPSSCSVTFTATQGDGVMVSTGDNDNCFSGPTISDSFGTSYTKISYGHGGGSDISVGVWYAIMPSSGSNTVTATCTMILDIGIAEFSHFGGIGNTNAPWVQTGNTISQSMSTSAGSVVYQTVELNDRSVGVSCPNSDTYTPNSGQILIQKTCATSSQLYNLGEWESSSTGGSNSYNMAVSGGAACCLTIGALVEIIGSGASLTVSMSPTSASLPAGGSATSTLTVSSSPSTTPGTYAVTTIAGSLGLARSTTVSVAVNGFSVSTNPSSASLLLAGASTTSTVTVTSLNGFTGNVTLTASSSPSGPVVSVWPSSLALTSGGSVTSILDISAGGGTPGNYTITLVGTSGPGTQSGTVALLLGGNFGISASPSSLTIRGGKSATSTLNLTSQPAFAGLGFAGVVSITNQASISITATSTDDSFCRSFGLLFDQSLDTQFWNTQPSSVVGTGCTPFNYSHTYTLSAGSHFLEFGVSAWVGHWHAQITLNGVTVASVDSDVNHHVHVPFSLGGIAISPTVSNGPTTSLSPPSVTLSAGGSKTMTLTVSTTSRTPTGTYTITVTATSGGLTHSVTITVNVT